MANKLKKLQHLYKRAAFDFHPSKLLTDLERPLETIVKDLFSQSTTYTDLTYLESPLKNNRKRVTKIRILKSILRSAKETKLLNISWMKKMTRENAQLREKMTFFWHDHFACGGAFAYLLQEQNNTIRKHALGNFGDLLHAIAKDPAMILYLNNQQNVKRSPNENFAREVMELFTLGIGNYSENDIKEAARAFTGWQVDMTASFHFNQQAHDGGTKVFRNEIGRFGGEDILDMLLRDKQTSNFICTKIYKEFVNENVNNQHVKELSEVLYNSNYDISKMLYHLFTADWFYDDENIGSKIVSPVELLVGYQRMFHGSFSNDKIVFASQKLLGQVLFMPPNVAGWKGGKDWIDSNTLMFRIRLPLLMFKDYPFQYAIKPELESQEQELVNSNQSKFAKLKLNADWNSYYILFSKFGEKELAEKIVEALISASTETIDIDLLSSFATAKNKNENIKNLVIHTMSLPEFQLI